MKIGKLKNQKIVILGLGLSGFETALALQEYQENIIVVDAKLNSKYATHLQKAGYTLYSEADFLNVDQTVDIIIKSPGIPFDNQVLVKYRFANITNDIELSYEYIQEHKLGTKIVAVTGTNGKTSTVLFLEACLQTAGFLAQSSGNIGISPLSVLENFDNLDYLILELSSFQLKHISKFRPHSAFITNVTPDHLNMHKDFEDYLESKKRIYSNQTCEDILYVKKNFYDKYLQSEQLVPQVVKNNVDDVVVEKISIEKLGSLNFNNALLCYRFLKNENIDERVFFQTLEKCPNLEHRMEYVADIEGVKYYNDSKATNLEATKEALKKLKNIILIVGGKSKGQEIVDFSKYLTNVKTVIVYGENAQEFNSEKIYKVVNNLEDAVEIAKNLGECGDNILLSPASASFDQFLNYRHRGDSFKKIVKEMEKK